jgi:hypothetical protein
MTTPNRNPIVNIAAGRDLDREDDDDDHDNGGIFTG